MDNILILIIYSILICIFYYCLRFIFKLNSFYTIFISLIIIMVILMAMQDLHIIKITDSDITLTFFFNLFVLIALELYLFSRKYLKYYLFYCVFLILVSFFYNETTKGSSEDMYYFIILILGLLCVILFYKQRTALKTIRFQNVIISSILYKKEYAKNEDELYSMIYNLLNLYKFDLTPANLLLVLKEIEKIEKYLKEYNTASEIERKIFK